MMVLMFIADDRRFGAAHMALLDRLSLPTSVSRIEHQQPPPNVRFWLLQGPVKWPALFARARRAQYACARLPASVRVPQPAPQPFDPFRLVHRIYFSRSDRFPSAPFSATTSRASISRARAGYTGSNQPYQDLRGFCYEHPIFDQYDAPQEGPLSGLRSSVGDEQLQVVLAAGPIR